MEVITSIDKNNKIKNTLQATRNRRTSMKCCVYTVKVQYNKLNNQQKNHLKMLFVEAKWLYNHINNLSKNDDFNVFNVDYKDFPNIQHFDKDHNIITSELQYLSSQMQQGVVDGYKQNIKALAKSKKKGNKVGSLKFLSEYNSINLKQANISYKIVDKCYIKIQGIKKAIKVNGLKQIHTLGVYELANAKLIQNCNGFYLAITVYTPKQTKIGKTPIGIDLGCKTAVTTSEGVEYNCIVEESERLKRLQRRFNRKIKGSNNRYKLRKRLRKEYLYLSNCKADASNKICNRLTSNNYVIMQDEQLNAWKRRFGRKIQHSILGRVKHRLLENEHTVVLSKWFPTTKLCRDCGNEVTLSLSNRTYICEHCGCVENRDVHAANNMVWIYQNIVGTEHTEITLAEFKKRVKAFFEQNQEAAKSLV